MKQHMLLHHENQINFRAIGIKYLRIIIYTPDILGNNNSEFSIFDIIMARYVVRKAIFSLVSSILLMPASAMAACIAAPAEDLKTLQSMVYADPKQALRRTSRIQRASDLTAERRGWLHAINAFAFSRLEENDHQQAEAEKGLALPLDPKSDVYAELLSQRATALSSSQDTRQALAALLKLRALPTTSLSTGLCLDGTVGILHNGLGNESEAITALASAYRAATKHGLTEQQFALSVPVIVVLMRGGDYAFALSILEDAERFARSHNYTMELENLAFARGHIALRMQNYAEARNAFVQMRGYATQLKDYQGIGYAALPLCETFVELRQFRAARIECQKARQMFALTNGKSNTPLMWLEARLDLAAGNQTAALAKLNQALAEPSPATSHAVITKIYGSRAKLLSQMGRWKEAAADLLIEQARRQKEVEDSRLRYSTAMRARFEADLRQLENARLQQTILLTQEREERQRANLWAVMGWTLFAVLALLVTLAFVLRRQRRVSAHARQAEELARTKADFLANMSHEIRAPLSGLIMTAQRLGRSKGIPDESRTSARSMIRIGERLIDLLEDLLLFSRIESNALPIRTAPFDPRALIMSIAETAQARAAETDIVIDTAADPNVPETVIGDPGKTSQIVTNLVENAIRHSGGKAVRIVLTSSDDHSYAITVADDGKGIDPDAQGHVFKRFAQINGALGRDGGTGLGLAITRGLCELLGGDISLTSDVGKGTQVCVRLPRSVSTQADEPSRPVRRPYAYQRLFVALRSRVRRLSRASGDQLRSPSFD